MCGLTHKVPLAYFSLYTLVRKARGTKASSLTPTPSRNYNKISLLWRRATTFTSCRERWTMDIWCLWLSFPNLGRGKPFLTSQVPLARVSSSSQGRTNCPRACSGQSSRPKTTRLGSATSDVNLSRTGDQLYYIALVPLKCLT